MKKPSRISDVFEEVLAAQGLSSVVWMVRLSSEWPEIVGPILSAKSSPSMLKNGVLTVRVRDHSWAQELQLRKPGIIRKISEALREERIRDIRFVAGLHAGEDPDAEQPDGSPPPSGISFVEPDGISGIADPETREILRSISRKARTRRR